MGTTDSILTIVIDTEEDDWGSYDEHGASAENIAHLPAVQDLFDEFGARPTYVVNRPPLLDPVGREVLGTFAERPDIEIGTHCHPWNTPPFTGGGHQNSMMCSLSVETNRAKVRSMTQLLRQELGVRPVTFRAGRWGFGPTVAQAIASEGYLIDCSVSPLIDWTDLGGPDYSSAPLAPYRCAPDAPLEVEPGGSLAELPTTVGYLRGDPRRRNRLRQFLERSPIARLKGVGVLDWAAVLARRWLSPEFSSASEMVRLASAGQKAGARHLSMTFHSCTLLPGATPFVRDLADRERFLQIIREFLEYSRSAGLRFMTIREAASSLGVLSSD